MEAIDSHRNSGISKIYTEIVLTFVTPYLWILARKHWERHLRKVRSMGITGTMLIGCGASVKRIVEILTRSVGMWLTRSWLHRVGNRVQGARIRIIFLITIHLQLGHGLTVA
jgi:hypothetical protein